MSNIEAFKKLLVDWEKVEFINLDYDAFDMNKMRKVLNSQKYLRRQDYRNKELKDINIAMSNLNKFLTSTMGWIHCNPSEEKIVQLSNEAFLLVEEKRLDTKILNTKIGMETFLTYLVDKQKEANVVSIVGRKGEGKTYTQNFFLNNYTNDLIAHGYTWFRVDLTKVLRYQRKYGKWMSIDKYLYTQIVYVYFRYSQTMNTTRGIDEILSKVTFSELIREVKQEHMGDDFDELFHKIKNICMEKYTGNDGLNKPFDEKYETFVTLLASSIIKLLKNKGYFYLLFIDGFDNVDYIYDDNQDRWIDQIYNSSMPKELQPSRYVLTCRQETLIYIEQYLRKKPHGSWSNSNDDEFTIEVLSHKDVLNKFLPSILDKNLSKKFPRIVEKMEEFGLDKELLEGTDKALLEDFYHFGLNFDEYISTAINERHGKYFKLDKDEVLDTVYNGSLRDILYDIKHAYMYIYYFLKERRFKKRLQMESVTEYLNNNKKRRSFYILSALPRNGSIYFNEINVFEPPYMLLHSLNLFSSIDFRKYGDADAKDLLLAVVILNFLKMKDSKFRNEIIKYCNDQGFNNVKIIKDIEKKLLEHGLIELCIDGAENENYQFLPRIITKRGNYSLGVIQDMNVLHSFSYTLYFPQKFIESGIVKAHKNDLSDYSSAQVTNVLSMLKLFQIYQKDITDNIFDLFNDNIKNQLIGFVTSMSENEVGDIVTKFQKFIDEYGDLEQIGCDFTKNQLFEMFKNGELSNEEFERKLNQCF